MNFEEITESFRRLFNNETKTYSSDGFAFTFEGNFNNDKEEQKLLKTLTNNFISNDLAVILSHLSGTTIFREGVDVKFYKINELERINRDLEEFKGQFFPTFIIIAEDYAGDFLVLYNQNGKTHFGNLDHAAWGAIDCWVDGAISFAQPNEWFDMILNEPEESTILISKDPYKLNN